MNDFQVGAPLGRGKFGRVFLAREKSTHYMVALKTLYKVELVKGKVEKQALREIEIQSHLRYFSFIAISFVFDKQFKLQFFYMFNMFIKCLYIFLRHILHFSHPHILQLLTYFHDEKKIYLVLEYAAGGELYKELKRQPGERFNQHL